MKCTSYFFFSFEHKLNINSLCRQRYLNYYSLITSNSQVSIILNLEHWTFFSDSSVFVLPSKKSVVAILNCMVYPDWRHLPKYKEDYSSQMKKDIELAWDSEPSEPTTYEFYYKILDGDNCGRDPSDREYSWKSKSCLASIANNTNKVCNWYWSPFIVPFLWVGGGRGIGG